MAVERVVPLRVNAESMVPERQLPEAPRPGHSEARRAYIRKDVELVRYGYTTGCQGCRAARLNSRAQPHNEQCRNRIQQAMIDDPHIDPTMGLAVAEERIAL